MIRSQLRMASLMFAAFAFLGCMTFPVRYQVAVSSLADPTSTAKNTYWILPGNKNVDANDLQFREYLNQVERALTSRGFQQASTLETAETVIFLSYGIGNPQQHVYSYAIPQYGQTGVSSSTTFGTINSYGNSSSFTGSTYYTPQYGITGYTTGVGSYTTYYRFVTLDAYDLQQYEKTKKTVELWRTEIGSSGRSDDLRSVFPALIAASTPYIATDTGKIVTITLSANDPSISAITGEQTSTGQ